jgi:PKD repeat protein
MSRSQEQINPSSVERRHFMFRTAFVSIALLGLAGMAAGQVIYSNGPLVTHPGGGAGGADASALEPTLSTFGFTASNSTPGTVVGGVFRVADDFTVPCGEVWGINSISVFAYQTGSTTTSSFQSGNYRIWNGQPGVGGSFIVADHSASNQMTATSWTNAYRVQTTTLMDVARPIMRIDMSGNSIILGPGEYWLDYALNGSINSGPFVPPITILGSNVTGNGVQDLGGGVYQPLVSGPVPGFAQGLPFEIDHNVGVPVGPVALFSASPATGSAPLLVSFTDASCAGATSWAWDFDNDGITDSTVQNPSHTYTCPGSYTVALTVSDGVNPASTLTKPNYITVTDQLLTVVTSGGGVGDLDVTPVPTSCGPAMGATEGWTLISFDTSLAVGQGPVLGLVPDAATLQFLLFPAQPGNIIHFTVAGAPAYPDGGTFSFPAGTFSPLVGASMDAVMLFLGPGGTYLHHSNVQRVTF